MGSPAKNRHNCNAPCVESERDLTPNPCGNNGRPFITEQRPRQLITAVMWTTAATSVGQKMTSGWSKAKVARQEGMVACLSAALGRPQVFTPQLRVRINSKKCQGGRRAKGKRAWSVPEHPQVKVSFSQSETLSSPPDLGVANSTNQN